MKSASGNAKMKKIILLLAIVVSVITNAFAQVSKVSLQASGLTCSMCSNAINKALKTLDFVEVVNADLKTYTFEILFKPKAPVDFDLIRKKVEDAGFTVTGFVATIHFNNVQISKGQPITIQDHSLLFINVNGQLLNGPRQVRILDKGFVSARECKRNAFPALSPHVYYATL